MSVRTPETSFVIPPLRAVWRQQIRLMEALSLVAAGASIAQVTYDVGYDSPSGFAAMFRRAFRVPPRPYLKP